MQQQHSHYITSKISILYKINFKPVMLKIMSIFLFCWQSDAIRHKPIYAMQFCYLRIIKCLLIAVPVRCTKGTYSALPEYTIWARYVGLYKYEKWLSRLCKKYDCSRRIRQMAWILNSWYLTGLHRVIQIQINSISVPSEPHAFLIKEKQWEKIIEIFCSLQNCY